MKKLIALILTLLALFLFFGCCEGIYWNKYQYCKQVLIKEVDTCYIAKPALVEVRDYIVIVYTQDSIFTYRVLEKKENMFLLQCNKYEKEQAYIKFSPRDIVLNCIPHGQKLFFDR